MTGFPPRPPLKPLPAATEEAVFKLLTDAKIALDKGDRVAREKALLDAWGVIPAPKLEYIRGQILTGRMVEFYRDGKEFSKAREWLRTAVESYGSETNPYVMLLRGTLAFEEGATDEAVKVLGALYEADGSRPFEAIAPKYLEFIREKIPKRRPRR
jgi:hypothetical protein